MKSSQEITAMRAALLHWYQSNGRNLPWRIRPEDRAQGVKADPYKIWLSEIMCQQTTTTSASAYWHKFLKLWPKVEDLAAAQRDDVLAAWAGLGYYARARNLHKCAQIVCRDYAGAFPRSEAELLKLPGIGPYSAAAIASICYNEATNVVDGNVERVISRIFCVETPLPKAKAEIRALAASLADPIYPGDYAQGLMDLGAHICKPKNPQCAVCPWQSQCAGFGAQNMQEYPKRQPKTPRPVRYGAVFFIEDHGKIWLRQRPDKGLLGGMLELPGTQWVDAPLAHEDIISQAPVASNWQSIEPKVKHVFTHFTLYLSVFRGVAPRRYFDICADLDALDDYALPSLMRKAIEVATA